MITKKTTVEGSIKLDVTEVLISYTEGEEKAEIVFRLVNPETGDVYLQTNWIDAKALDAMCSGLGQLSVSMRNSAKPAVRSMPAGRSVMKTAPELEL